MDRKPIEYVTNWPHLGNILEQNQMDSDYVLLRRQLIEQINDVICLFGKLTPVVKTDLLYKFCSNLYSSVLWDIQSNETTHV